MSLKKLARVMSTNSSNNEPGSPDRAARNTHAPAPGAPRVDRTRTRVDFGPHEAGNCMQNRQPRCNADGPVRPPTFVLPEEGDNAAAAAINAADTPASSDD